MTRRRRIWPIYVALIAAVSLEVIVLPDVLEPLRPPLPMMVLIYWAMMWPDRFGLGVAFCLGLCLDILHGQLLGQNALALVVVTYFTIRFHLQIRIFPLWQLTMTVFALLATGAFIDLLIEGIAGLPGAGLTRWSRILAGTITWPLVMGVMDRLRMQVEYRSKSFD